MDVTAVHVEMPDSSVPTALPGGWSVARDGDPLVVACPEKDLRVAFLARPLGGSMEDLARSAWREIEPEFDVPVRQQGELPTPDGWDNTIQILYNTPAIEGRLAVAVIRTLGDRAYVSLIDGTSAAFSRRSAQLSAMMNAWKPAGLREPSLAGASAGPFGKDESRAMSGFITDHQGLAEATHGGNTLGFSAEMLFIPEHGIGMVVLTNMRAANLFLNAVHQRLLEVLFGAESKAEAMAEGGATNRHKSLERTRERILTDPASVAWIDTYLGRIASEDLGPAEIRRSGEGFQVEFESWFSDLGVEEQSGESRQIVLTSAPWLGSVRFQVSDDTDTLILDGGQTRYTFSRVP